MTAGERARLVEQAASAWRPRDRDGRVRAHPAWYDLDDTGRREAFGAAAEIRRIEASLDREGLSSTARAVLARIGRDR
jgi:hypothetical protein